MPIISLTCNDCGGVLETKDGQQVVFCPYCGSKALIIESDDVKKTRIKYDTYKEVTTQSYEHTRQSKYDDYELEKKKQRDRIRHSFLTALGGIIFLLFLRFLMHYT